MNKNLMVYIRNTKVLIILFFHIGILFLILFFVIWFSTGVFSICVATVFILFSIVFFIISSIIKKNLKVVILNNGWVNNDKFTRFAYFFFIFLFAIKLIFALIILIWYMFFDYRGEFLFLAWQSFFYLWLYIFVIYLYHGMMKESKNYESKLFPDWSFDGIELIEKLLIKNDINFNKEGEKKIKFFIKYVEIFKLKDDINIKFYTALKNNKKKWFYPKLFFSLSISIGPITEENNEKIKMLKNLIDKLDK